MTTGTMTARAATTSRPGRVRLTARLVAVADRVHRAADDRARADGLDVRRVGLTGRAYRHPGFDALGGAR